MTIKNIYEYPEQAPHFQLPRLLKAYLEVSCMEGRSAFAIQVEDATGHEAPLNETRASKSDDSRSPRAELMGLVAVLEAAFPGSTIDLVASQYVRNVVEGCDSWKAKGCRNSSGPVPNWDIIARIMQVRDERKLTVAVRPKPLTDRREASIMTALDKQAKITAKTGLSSSARRHKSA